MRTVREKHNDSLLIWEWVGILIVGTIMFLLPVILWYVSRFITFMQGETAKEFIIGFFIGFSILPLLLFIVKKKNERKII